MKKRTINRQLYLWIITILVVLSCFNINAVTAKAETVHTVEEVAEHIVFITFKKGYSDERGNYLCASFFFPEEYFEDEYEYGVAVFPENYITKYELYGDYIARKEAEGIAIQLLLGSGGRVGNGKLCNYNILHIPERGLSRRLAYVMFVQNSDGEVAYKEPVVSSFSETTTEELTTEELVIMAKKRQNVMNMDKSFEKLVKNSSELIDSIWIYLVIGCSSVVAVWGAYIGIRIAVAKKNEQKVDGKGMLKNLLIGTVVMFVLAVALPLLIKGLAAMI